MTDLTQQPAPQQPVSAPVQQPAPVNPMLDPNWHRQQALEEEDGQRKMWESTMRTAIDTDPAVYAEANRVASVLKMPLDAVRSDPAALRAVARLEELRQLRLEETSPVLFRSMAGMHFANLSYQEAERLSTFERLWQNAKRGWQQAERGRLATRLMLGDETAREDFEKVDAIYKKMAPGEGFWGSALEFGGQWAESALKSAGVGLVGGAATAGVVALAFPPAALITAPLAFKAGFGTFFTSSMIVDGINVEAGNAYADMVGNGFDPDRARLAAIPLGVVNGLLNVWGMKAANSATTSLIKGAIVNRAKRDLSAFATSSFLRAAAFDTVKSAGAETFTETVQDANSILAEYFAAEADDPNTASQGAGAIVDRLWETAVKTAQGMALLSLPGGAIAGRNARIMQARNDAFRSFGEQAIDSASSIELAKAAPTEFGEFAGKVAEANGVPATFVVDGQTLANVLRQADKEVPAGDLVKSAGDQLEAVQPGIQEAIRQAEQMGTDVELGTVEVLSKLGAGSPALAKAIIAQARLDPESAVGESALRVAKDVAEQKGKADTGTDAEVQFAESVDAVRKTVDEELGAALTEAGSKVSGARRQAASRIIVETVANMARRQGADPKEFFEANRLRFAPMSESSGDLQQPSLKLDSPEFKAWFGESKVTEMDKYGTKRPLVVYHSTDAKFDVFKYGELGFHFGTKQQAETIGGERTIRAYLSISNPIRMRDVGAWTRTRPMLEELRRLAPSKGWTEDELFSVEAKLEAGRSELRSQLDSKDGAVVAKAQYEASAPVREFLESKGYDGIRYRNEAEGSGDSYIAFKPTQIKSTRNRGTFDRNDPNILRQDARGEFDTNALLAIFGKKADVSTVLHELGHYYTEVLSRVASQQADGPLAQDWKVLLDRWGVADTAAWEALTPEQRNKHLEDFTYNFEDYLATGEAPSVELKSLFQRIKSWIVAIYRNVRGSLNEAYRSEFGTDLPALTPELRGVFDRMLASEQAIETAIAERSGATLFAPDAAKKLKLSDDDIAGLRMLEEERRAEASERMDSDALRGTRMFESSRRKAEAGVKRMAAEERAKVEAQVTEEVDADPVYAAQTFLREGEVADDEGNKSPAKLNLEAVKSLLGDDAARFPKGLTRRGGQSPDAMAGMLGFSSGEAMVRAILNAPPREDLIAQRVAERLSNDSDSLTNPKNFRRAIEEALHGKAATRLASTYVRILLNKTRTTAEIEAAAKEGARLTLAAMPVGRIKMRVFSAAEVRASKEAREALASGDSQKVLEAARKYLLQHYLTRLSMDVEREVEGFLDGTVRKVSQSDASMKGRNLDLVNAARAILNNHGLASQAVGEAATRYLQTLRQRAPEDYETAQQRVDAASRDAKPWREMALDDFRVLQAEIDALWFESKAVNQFRTWDGKTMAKTEVQADLWAAGIANVGNGANLPFKTAGDEGSWDYDQLKTVLTRIEHWTRKMDGGKAGGPWHRYIYRTLRAGLTDYNTSQIEASRWWRNHLRKFDDLNGQKIDATKWLGDEGGLEVTWRNRAHLIGALLQMGTVSNFQNMILGHGWGTMTEDGVLHTRWHEMIEDYAKRGILTKQDFELVQGVWDWINANLRGQIQDALRQQEGRFMVEVEASPVQTPFGTLRGGYFPSKIDYDHPRNQGMANREAIDALRTGKANFREASRSVPKGMTITRQNKVVRPRVLELSLVGDHIDEALRIIHIQGPIDQVASLFTGGPFVQWLERVQPKAQRNIIFASLKRMAANQIVAGGLDSNVRRIATWLRSSFSQAVLGLSLRNSLQQYTGIANGANEVGAGPTWTAFWSLLRNGSTMTTDIRNKSRFMSNRWSPELQALQHDIDAILRPSTIRDIQNWTNRYGYILQRVTQLHTDAIVWKAAYDKEEAGLLAGGMEADKARNEAIQRADSAVRLTQGERSPLDIATAFSGDAVKQLFTQFGDYPNLVLNQIMMQPDGKKRAAAIAMALLVPSIASSAIALALSGGAVGKGARSGYEDDEKWPEEWATYVFGGLVRSTGALVPVVGPLAAAAGLGAAGIESRVDERFDAFPAAGLVSTLLRVATGRVAEGEITNRDVRDVATVIGSFLHLPSKPAGDLAGYLLVDR